VIRSGLYFDEHLEQEVDRPLLETDRTFVGIELLGVTNPLMVIVVTKLWATGIDDPDDPNAITLLTTDITGNILYITVYIVQK